MNVLSPIRLISTDAAGIARAFRQDVLEGLSASPKSLPSHWFYDLEGSRLFEQITRLPEYYPTRTEIALLGEIASEIAELTGKGRPVVEFGSGSSRKTPLLLRAVEPSAYVPIDISGEFLLDAAADLNALFPTLPILPVEADFTQSLTLPLPSSCPPLGFFPGSTIGNFTQEGAVRCLQAMRATLGADAQLLIGFDRVKSRERLIAAYDDAHGVTAAFNLNLLHRINRELGAEIPVSLFRHMAIWNAVRSRIEMHLLVLDNVEFTIENRRFTLEAGEMIHTENSHKYTPASAGKLLEASGWRPTSDWSDEQDDFLVILADSGPVP